MSEKTKHTPGPWEVDSCGDPLIVNGPEHGDASIVAILATDAANAWGYGEEETRANARLIAAAPDLLDAAEEISAAASAVIGAWECGDLAAAVNLLDACRESLRDAISKAKGE